MVQGLKGFTFVEILITIVIAAILLTIGIPSFVSMIESNRAEASIRTISMSFAFARAHALAYDQDIIICPSDGCSGNWKTGFTIKYFRSGYLLKEINSFDESDHVAFGSTSVVFKSNGTVMFSPASLAAVNFIYCPSSTTNPHSTGIKLLDSGLAVKLYGELKC